jgi:hypothetical protein
MVVAARTDRMARLVTEATADLDTQADSRAVRPEVLGISDTLLLEFMSITLPVTDSDIMLVMAP